MKGILELQADPLETSATVPANPKKIPIMQPSKLESTATVPSQTQTPKKSVENLLMWNFKQASK